jgi:hypothetical protein
MSFVYDISQSETEDVLSTMLARDPKFRPSAEDALQRLRNSVTCKATLASSEGTIEVWSRSDFE